MFTIDNIYAFAGQISGSLVALLIISYILCWVGQWVWSWLDDEDVGKVNKLSDLLNRYVLRGGYIYPVTDNGGDVGYYYSDDKNDEGKYKRDCKGNLKRAHEIDRFNDFGVLFFISVGLAVIPMLIALVFSNLHISLCVAGFFALAFTTRGGRRLQKKVNAHVDDKKLHTVK